MFFVNFRSTLRMFVAVISRYQAHKTLNICLTALQKKVIVFYSISLEITQNVQTALVWRKQ